MTVLANGTPVTRRPSGKGPRTKQAAHRARLRRTQQQQAQTRLSRRGRPLDEPWR